MSGHTKGPWWYQERSDAYTHIVRAGENRFVCQLPQDTSGTAEANARLIAAAPDLLEALNRIKSLPIGGPHISAEDGMATCLATIDRIRHIAVDAIARATTAPETDT